MTGIVVHAVAGRENSGVQPGLAIRRELQADDVTILTARPNESSRISFTQQPDRQEASNETGRSKVLQIPQRRVGRPAKTPLTEHSRPDAREPRSRRCPWRWLDSWSTATRPEGLKPPRADWNSPSASCVPLMNSIDGRASRKTTMKSRAVVSISHDEMRRNASKQTLLTPCKAVCGNPLALAK